MKDEGDDHDDDGDDEEKEDLATIEEAEKNSKKKRTEEQEWELQFPDEVCVCARVLQIILAHPIMERIFLNHHHFRLHYHHHHNHVKNQLNYELQKISFTSHFS